VGEFDRYEEAGGHKWEIISTRRFTRPHTLK
jgi:hypothetical protein